MPGFVLKEENTMVRISRHSPCLTVNSLVREKNVNDTAQKEIQNPICSGGG